MRPRILFFGLSLSLAAVACLLHDDADVVSFEDGGPPGGEGDAGGDGGLVGDGGQIAPNDGASSCVSPGDAASVVKEGTRLRPVYLTSPDGLELLVGTRDTLVGENCTPIAFASEAPAIVLGCFPATTFTYAFSDSSCTQQIVVGRPNHANQYAVVGAESVVLLGDALDPSQPVYTSTGGGCEVRNAAASYAITKIEGNPGIVRLAEARKPLTTTMDAVVYAGEDGSEIYSGAIYDHVHGSPPHVAMATDGVQRWLPQAIEEGMLVRRDTPIDGSDSAAYCATPGDFVSLGTVGPMAVAVTIGFDEPEWDAGPAHVVRKVTPATAQACRCTPVDGGAPSVRCTSEEGHVVTDVVPPCEFEPVGHSVAGTRLSLTIPTVAGIPVYAESASRVSLPVLRDQALGIRCVIAKGEDGQLRCLPAPYPHGFFLDANCSTPVVAALPGETPPAALRLPESDYPACVGEADTWPPLGRVFSPATAVSPGPLYSLTASPGSCLKCELLPATTVEYFTSTYSFYTVTPISPAPYAPVTLELR